MFSSLRHRLFIGFGFVILLTVGLSGLISAITTTNRFDILITEQGNQRAREIAPLLEASFTFHGNWNGVINLLQSSPEEIVADDSVFVEWISDVDWYDVAANTIAIDIDTLFADLEAVGSLADLAVRQNVDPEQVNLAILAAEQEAVETAVAAQELSAEEGAQYLAMMAEEIDRFVYEPLNQELIEPEVVFLEGDVAEPEFVDWDVIIQQQLNLSEEAYFRSIETQSIAELAREQNVPLDQIEQAIIQAEVAYLQRDFFYSDGEYMLALADTVAWVRAYLTEDYTFYDATSNPLPFGSGLLASYLLGDEQLLIVQTDGTVVYDSVADTEGEQLAADMLAQGVPLKNLNSGEHIGTALVATGTGFYNAQQQTFLQGVTSSLIISGGVAALIGLLVAAVLSQQITSPVTALTQAARRVAGGQSTKRLPITSKDELGQMSHSFNQMADALKLQQQLRQRLVRDVSHELNTPLSIIQLEMKALNDGLQTPAQAYAHVHREIDLLHKLVDDLTQLTEAEQAQLPLDLALVDLCTITKQAVSRLLPKAETKQISLHFELPMAALPLAEVDVARLTQVLGNLIDNAVRHTPENGRITITCQYSPLTQLDIPAIFKPATDEERPWLVTTVTDSGVGIAEADLPLLFERFYRTDASRNRHSGGRGLGLSIVRQIIEAHGGYVWAANAPKQGSLFGYALPPANLQ